MQIVIDIPTEMYERIAITPRCATFFDAFNDRDIWVKGIQNGTPLPKGHGRLIDADAYAKKYDTNINGRIGEEYVIAPTIIEADKGE